MDRREFTCTVTLLAAPFAVSAQPSGKIARIGYLSPLSAGVDAAHLEAFRQGLRALGHREGQNIAIEARYADGRFERLPDLAAELVRIQVDVIVTAVTPSVRAAQRASQTIPVVMAFSADPVGDGFVATLARPGGNITGLSAAAAEMTAKRVEFLKTIVPTMSHVSYLANPQITRRVVTESEAAGRALGLRASTMFVRNSSEVARALASAQRAGIDGLIVDLTLRDHWKQIVDLSLKHHLPTAAGPREFVEAGGLVAYGPHYPDLFRRAATYVDRILKGAKPADLPVEQPTKFELVINLKTAKALGLTIPPTVLARADEVVQ